MTASTDAALNGGSCQLRSRNSRMPWNRPQSTSTRARSASIKYFEPVTVPAAPQKESVAIIAILNEPWRRSEKVFNEALLPLPFVTPPQANQYNQEKEPATQPQYQRRLMTRK